MDLGLGARSSMLSVKGDLPDDELTRIAEDIVKRRLETIERRRSGPDRSAAASAASTSSWTRCGCTPPGVTALEVQRAIGVSNADVARRPPRAGPDRGHASASIGRVGSPGAPRPTSWSGSSGDHAIRVRDVAEIVDGVEDAESARLQRDGVSSVVLAVRKQSGGNTAAVDAARAARRRARASLAARRHARGGPRQLRHDPH